MVAILMVFAFCLINTSFGQPPVSLKGDIVLYYCDFDSNICDIRQQATKNTGYKWLVTHKRTFTDKTGPETAHSNGRYVYAEASQGKPGDTIMMQTGWMEPRSPNISISFYSHMYGVHVGHLRLFVQVCNGVTSTSKLVWDSSGNHGKDWLRVDTQVQLGESPRRFKLKFEAVRGIGDMGDIAIDTLTVKDTPAPQESCYNGLGIENGVILDSALTASSSFGTNYRPQYSRLNSIPEPPSKGGWSAGKLNVDQWIQVDLGDVHLVTGIAVQVRYELLQWVSTYAVSYKLDDNFSWKYITDEHNNNVVFCGYTANPDKRAVRAHFTQPIRARFIRVNPLTWHLYISLRWEVYGCKDSLFLPANRTVSAAPTVRSAFPKTSPSESDIGGHKQTPILQMGNITKYPNQLVTSGDSSADEMPNKTTAGVSLMNLPEDVQDGKGYSLVLAEIVCISIGLALLIVSVLIISCLTRKLKRQKENCSTPAQSRRRLLYNAYECIDELKSRSIINNAYSTYSLNSCIDKDAVYQDIQDIKRRDEKNKKQDRSSIGCMLSGLESVGKIVTVARSKTWSHSDDFKEHTLPRKSSSMGNERRPEMFVRYPLSKKAPPRIEFRCKVPRTPPPPVPCLPPPDHAKTFHVREYCSAPELPRPRPHSDLNVHSDAGSKRNVRHTVFLQPANTHVQKTRDLSIVRMSNLSDNLGYSDAIYAEPKDTLLDNEAKTSLAKSKDSAFDYESDAEDETIWEDNPIYEDSDSLSDTDYTTSTLDYSESNVMFRIGCFADYDEMGNDFIRKSHIYSEIPEIK